MIFIFIRFVKIGARRAFRLRLVASAAGAFSSVIASIRVPLGTRAAAVGCFIGRLYPKALPAPGCPFCGMILFSLSLRPRGPFFLAASSRFHLVESQAERPAFDKAKRDASGKAFTGARNKYGSEAQVRPGASGEANERSELRPSARGWLRGAIGRSQPDRLSLHAKVFPQTGRHSKPESAVFEGSQNIMFYEVQTDFRRLLCFLSWAPKKGSAPAA